MALEETPGDRLTQAMKAAGAKNPEVAEAAGVHVTTVSRWRHDKQNPEEAELDRVVAFLRDKGLAVSASWIRYGRNGTSEVREPSAPPYRTDPPSISQLVFTSATAQQRAKVWLEGFLLELAEEGATSEFIDSSRRLLMNSANYEHGFGAPAGHRDEMDDDQKLRHMQALAVGIRAALKDRLKKGKRS